jgi:hypothetical protein
VATGILRSSQVFWGTIQNDEIFRNLQVKRSEFKSFIDDVGATQIGFNKDYVDAVVCFADDVPAGFSKKVKKGLLFFIPCAWARSDSPEYLVGHIKKLVAGLVAFSAKQILEPPKYTEGFSFAKETLAKERIKKIEKEELYPLHESLEFYREIKSVLWLGNNSLVKATDNLLQRMGFQTQIDEIYEEDLWIIHDSKRSIIVEIKGLNNNVTRADINKLDDHREARGCVEMTGLLIANTFMTADSFKSKDQPFPPSIIQKAVNLNLLITRTIDLCRIFDAFEEHSVERLMSSILGRNGWLSFKDGKIVLNCM